jgi:hypothetical protein
VLFPVVDFVYKTITDFFFSLGKYSIFDLMTFFADLSSEGNE